ncbi:PIR Superfamily Protein [Plasmodium ovale wallikeri]|uniref:PIR Superfamily Protein n=2 Tax=Plasmodium ovale TaxID=36330 RepID=A0A1A9ARN1_PLAOA|nr:PIR Superfamily Protein [Plasmodium ovale wallikeri]SBT58824.1 PIR Superfamily Protein [Plasmodium ovale wallikeri]SBT73713.1 Plasmodium vivax Vir protein, putative [Plasmodium ovale]
MEKWKVILDGSPAYEIYDKFDKANNLHDSDKYFDEALKVDIGSNKIQEICRKLISNLKNNSLFVGQGINRSERCKHLHFWLYDQISEIFSNNREYEKISKTISAIFTGWRNFNDQLTNTYCSGRFFEEISLAEWNEGKILHDYFINFHYNKKYDSDNVLCQKFHEYLTVIKDYYTNNKSKCIALNNSLCNLYFKYDEIYDPDRTLSNLKCNNLNSDVVSNEHSHVSPVERMDSGSYTSDSQLEELSTKSESPPSDSYSTVGVPVSLIGSLILFFFVYRFTPLESWIRRKLSKKITFEDNIDNVTEVSDNNSEFMGINHDCSILRVPYNSD